MANPVTQFDIDLVSWQKAKDARDKAVELEMELRKRIFAQAFPTAEVGVNTLPLGQGYELKGTRKLNYNLKNTKDGQETSDALDEIEKLGNEGKFIADRLVSWKPTLSLTEYKQLSADNPTHQKIKTLIDAVLTITDASPELEVKVPKSAI